MQEQGLGPSDVSAINIEMGPTGYNLVASPPNEKRRPGNIVEGQFSVYFAAAASVLDPYTWDSYRLLGSSETERLMDVTTASFDDSDDTMGSRVEVVAADGRRARRAVPLPKGEPENPMPWSEWRRSSQSGRRASSAPKRPPRWRRRSRAWKGSAQSASLPTTYGQPSQRRSGLSTRRVQSP